MSGDLILPHDNYPVQGNTNKAVSYETQREIFLSRHESFLMETDINRQKGGRIMGSLSMNQNDLFEIPAPKFGNSAVNKNYVDGEISKIPSVDSTQFIKKSGDRMSGVLDINSYSITNVGINLSDDTTAVPKSYVDSFANTAVLNPLTTDLYMNNFQIKQLKTPTEDKDAINNTYFEDELLKFSLIVKMHSNTCWIKMNLQVKITSVLMELLISMEVHIKTKKLILSYLPKTVMGQMIIDQELESISSPLMISNENTTDKFD